MKKIVAFALITTFIHAKNIELSVSGAQQTRMPIAILILDDAQRELDSVAQVIKKDLHFTEQFQPKIINTSKQKVRKEIQKLCNHGTPLALCINAQKSDSIEWRVYDTMQCTMLAGKEYKKRGTVERGWAHAIADETVKVLTGHEGGFSARLAYCKDSHNNAGKTLRKVYIADFDGSNEEIIVDVPTVCVAPRWHSTKPRLFYSEYTDTNVPLVSVSLKKKRKTASSFDGINMLPSFSPDGTAMVYCSSRGNGSCQLYYCKNGSIKRFTNNTGNNVSPIFIDNDRICFCSDYETGNPQIYIGNIVTGHLQRITKGGYCTSPAYCAKTNRITYHKMIQGTMQIVLYDCVTKNHTQLTHTNGNKHETSWSPSGTHLVFAHEVSTNKSRLARLNLVTNKVTYITKVEDQCSYPCCSPCYASFPVVT